MSDEPRPGVIGSLPSTRPHRRSDRRGAVPAPSATAKARSPRKPSAAGKSPAPTRASAARTAATAEPRAAATRPAAARRANRPAAKKPLPDVRTRARPAAPQPSRTAPAEWPAAEPPGTLQTLVQAAAELTELGLRAGARALRDAVARLPRP